MSDRDAEPNLPAWRQRIPAFWRLIRADKPIGWLLLLWPTWWALWMASGGIPRLDLLLIFTLGVWLTRSAGCVINDYADQWLDSHVSRTRNRPLVTGEISGKEALLLFAVLMLIAFALVLLTNWLTVYFSVAAVLLAATYPYLKRHTYLPQVWLGLSFGWGIPMAYTAVTNNWPPAEAWLLFAANMMWTTGYDTWYAMVDRDDDLREGAKSTAILFGDADLVAQGVLYSSFVVAMLLFARRSQLGAFFYYALAAAVLVILWQFWIARDRQRTACFRAFLANHWVGMLIFLGIGLHFARSAA